MHFAVIPAWGALSDRLGRRPCICSALSGMALWMFPFFALIDTGSFGDLLLAVTVGLILHGAMYAPQAAFFSEMFATRMRYSGASIGAQFSSVAAGAPAPLIATALLADYGSSTPIALYVIAAALLTVIADRLREGDPAPGSRDAVATSSRETRQPPAGGARPPDDSGTTPASTRPPTRPRRGRVSAVAEAGAAAARVGSPAHGPVTASRRRAAGHSLQALGDGVHMHVQLVLGAGGAHAAREVRVERAHQVGAAPRVVVDDGPMRAVDETCHVPAVGEQQAEEPEVLGRRALSGPAEQPQCVERSGGPPRRRRRRRPAGQRARGPVDEAPTVTGSLAATPSCPARPGRAVRP